MTMVMGKGSVRSQMIIKKRSRFTRFVPHQNKIKVLLDGLLLAACYPLAYVLRGLGGGRTERPRRVLMYGAGDAGEMIARDMMRPKRGHAYKTLGFVDDDAAKHGMSIHGLTVLGGREDVSSLVRRHKVDEIVITIP